MFYANSWGRLLAVSSSGGGKRSEAEEVQEDHSAEAQDYFKESYR